MRDSLTRWIGDADALRHMDQFGVRRVPLALAYQQNRRDDLYIALVGELFDRMRDGKGQPSDWARLGDALSQFALPERGGSVHAPAVASDEALLLAAAAFYSGGFPASAYVTMRSLPGPPQSQASLACYDLLARPTTLSSTIVKDLLDALVFGDSGTFDATEEKVAEEVRSSLHAGPDEWVPWRLLQNLLSRFRTTNLRAVLPDGQADLWTPLVASLVRRGTWDFFPSQIHSIQRGLLNRADTFSLQMPTGAGKTALCETLLFSHLQASPNAAAVLLVPYRSLASELRGTTVRRLNEMGISSRCAYGGTVPPADEVHAFDETRALVATPETLSGILTANATFAERISLVICDEGHLLDAPSRGIGLELLLARMKGSRSGTRRFVFVSAIVPNIEEVNAWLGGTADSVVRSDYRPAMAEFAVLRPVGRGASCRLDLEMHPHERDPIRYRIQQFLCSDDFQWLNPATGRQNTYAFSSVKTRAVAAARKALPLGTAVVFAANKRGNQGAVGLAEELLAQVEQGLRLPQPLSFANAQAIARAAEYLKNEYGPSWMGTRAIAVGAVLHHGDIPQETREVLEAMLRDRSVAMGICTNTLAEGVNLPIRTLVLYSVQRVRKEGRRENLLTRDIKNLVGRAGRAGATTKGLVICANEEQWPLVEAVAVQAAGESVRGALRSLMHEVCLQLAAQNLKLTNDLLENSPALHSLIDGIDATLVDLAAVEIGEQNFRDLASGLADDTFASNLADAASRQLLRDIFELRAQRVAEIRALGRLGWVREAGARLRMVGLVEKGLFPVRARWDDIADPLAPDLVDAILSWAWAQPEMQRAVRDEYRIGVNADLAVIRGPFSLAVSLWLSGASFTKMAEGVGMGIDDLLGVHAHVLAFTLQTIVDQGVALLEKLVLSRNEAIAPSVLQFAQSLRFGVPTVAGSVLAAAGVRHRRAFVALGNTVACRGMCAGDRSRILSAANLLLKRDPDGWRAQLGALVFENTLDDLAAFPVDD